jgi:2-dehydro-3-deoxygluconokinase
MTQKLNIACLGEAMIELVADKVPGTASVNVAGDTLNTAVYLRRALSEHHEVYFVTALGNDLLSQQMITFMRAEGVRTEDVARNSAQLPGIYSITTDTNGERSFDYWRQNSAAKNLFQKGNRLDFSSLEKFDLIYASAISLAILPHRVREGFLNWVDAFRRKGGQFAFDSNYRPALWESKQVACDCIDRAWSLCDIAIPSLDDEMALYGGTEADVVGRFATYPLRQGALKRGALGPIPLNSNISTSVEFPRAHFVVDTTAAGDSFSGAFLASILDGGSVENAMILGHEYASIVIGFRGAIIPRDTLNEQLMTRTRSLV